jgi:hypothetical protein
MPSLNRADAFTDVRGWMAQLVVLKDAGNLPNVTFGDDDDSRRFVQGVRRLNRGWKLGQVARLPVQVAQSFHPGENRPREHRPRRRRVARCTAPTRGDPSEPDDLDLFQAELDAWDEIGLESLGEGPGVNLPPISKPPTATDLRDRVLCQLNGESRDLSAEDRRRRERVRDALQGAQKGQAR